MNEFLMNDERTFINFFPSFTFQMKIFFALYKLQKVVVEAYS